MRKTFEKIVLPIFGVFGTSITILTFIFPTFANTKVSISLFVVVILFLLLLIAIIIKLNIDLRSEKNEIWRFVNFRIIPFQYVRDDNILIIDGSYNMPLNTCVSIFIKNGAYERIATIGYVSNILEKFTQITLLELRENDNFRDYLSQPSNLQYIVIRQFSNITDVISSLGRI